MAASPTTAKGTTDVRDPSRALQQQGRRAAEARATVPDATYTREVRVAQQERAGDQIIAAFAQALRAVPHANAAYRDAQIEQYDRVNIGLVLPDGEGSTSVTLLDADALTVDELLALRAELTAKLAGGEITAPDTAGATATVTDMSQTGVTAFTAVLTPPHAVALAIGGRQTSGTVMLTLTCDQRVLSPHTAAGVLDALAKNLQ